MTPSLGSPKRRNRKRTLCLMNEMRFIPQKAVERYRCLSLQALNPNLHSGVVAALLKVEGFLPKAKTRSSASKPFLPLQHPLLIRTTSRCLYSRLLPT